MTDIDAILNAIARDHADTLYGRMFLGDAACDGKTPDEIRALTRAMLDEMWHDKGGAGAHPMGPA